MKTWWNERRAFQADQMGPRMDKLTEADPKVKFSSIHWSVCGTLAAAMANKSQKGTPIEANSCFLSIATIAQRSRCSPRAAQDAINLLVSTGFFTKSALSGHKLRGRPSQSGGFDGVRYRLVLSVWDTIPVPWEKEKNDKEEKQPEAPPVPMPTKREPTPEEQAVLDSLDEPAPAAAAPAPAAEAGDAAAEWQEWRVVYDFLAQDYSNHPSITKHPATMLKPIIKECAELAGDARVVANVLYHLPPETKAYLAGVGSLGGAIRSAFKNYLAKFPPLYADAVIADLRDNWEPDEDGNVTIYTPGRWTDDTAHSFEEALNQKLGADLNYLERLFDGEHFGKASLPRRFFRACAEPEQDRPDADEFIAAEDEDDGPNYADIF